MGRSNPPTHKISNLHPATNPKIKEGAPSEEDAPRGPTPVFIELGYWLLPELTRLQCVHIRRRDAARQSTSDGDPAGTPAAIVHPVGSGASFGMHATLEVSSPLSQQHGFPRTRCLDTINIPDAPDSDSSWWLRMPSEHFHLAVPVRASGPVTQPGATLCLPLWSSGATLYSFLTTCRSLRHNPRRGQYSSFFVLATTPQPLPSLTRAP